MLYKAEIKHGVILACVVATIVTQDPVVLGALATICALFFAEDWYVGEDIKAQLDESVLKIQATLDKHTEYLANNNERILKLEASFEDVSKVSEEMKRLVSQTNLGAIVPRHPRAKI